MNEHANSAVWHWSEVCQALGTADPKPDASPTFSGAHIDSREIGHGQLFFALAGDPGARFNVSHRSTRDGHTFVAQAASAGVGILEMTPTATSDVARMVRLQIT